MMKLFHHNCLSPCDEIKCTFIIFFLTKQSLYNGFCFHWFECNKYTLNPIYIFVFWYIFLILHQFLCSIHGFWWAFWLFIHFQFICKLVVGIFIFMFGLVIRPFSKFHLVVVLDSSFKLFQLFANFILNHRFLGKYLGFMKLNIQNFKLIAHVIDVFEVIEDLIMFHAKVNLQDCLVLIRWTQAHLFTYLYA